LVDRIDAFLGFPAVDPHGDPIPRADGSLAQPPGESLSQLSTGSDFRLVRVIEQDKSFLRYLTECGLDLGTQGEVLENRPEAGALIVKVGDRSVALGIDAASKVMVVPITDRNESTKQRTGGS
jgi:DtxR family Mn-dependent transcriptional regulator